MVTLYEKETGKRIGEIAEEDVRFLIAALEEEWSEDDDYWLDADVIDLLEDAGARPELLEMLRSAVMGREGLEVRWERT